MHFTFLPAYTSYVNQSNSILSTKPETWASPPTTALSFSDTQTIASVPDM